jgi:phosphatidate cytidylyltransferase
MPRASEALKTRVVTALILLAILLAILWSHSFPVFAVAATVFFAAAAWESFRLFRNQRPMVGAAVWTAAFAFILFSGQFGDVRQLFVLFALCAAVWTLCLTPSLAFGLPPLDGLGSRLMNGIYGVAILGGFVAFAVLFKQGPDYLLSVMALVWVADIGAYFSGKAFGRHKLAPSISPGKSWEGAIGGWLAVLLLAGVSTMAPVLNDTFAAVVRNKWGWSGFAAVMTLLVAASVVGDLFESQLKRRAGFKDSSNLLPGHGGILDRIDALIPVLPLAVLIAWL